MSPQCYQFFSDDNFKSQLVKFIRLGHDTVGESLPWEDDDVYGHISKASYLHVTYTEAKM